MASVVPINASGIDIGRPGQQLLPGYVVKLLKTLKIPFGTERGMTGIDVDPTINLIGHIFECIGALREVSKVYRAKGSLASRSIGTRVLFGLTSELGNIILDAVTFDPPPELKEATIYYSQISSSILNVFPEIASQMNTTTGKVLLHQTALRTSAAMAIESLKLVIKAYPAAAWTPDKAGALPLHWITQNSACNSEMISLLIAANPKGPWVADSEGYLPLHWAVNQDYPNIDVVSALISANASAAAKPCNKGSLPLHWSVNRERPTIPIVKALAQVHPDAVRTFDKNGWLPLHQCVNRSEVSLEAVQTLIELYPQALQCPNSNGQLPLHRALDQTSPSFEIIKLMLEAFPGAAKVADDEGYLPLHLALDCSRPDPLIAQILLQHFPESAFHKSKDGLLPIHCTISSMHPVIDIVQQLLEIFPDSSEIMAVDLMPMDDTADPQTWQGEWIEKRWTPLSRAIDRGLDAIVVLFRMALNSNPQKTIPSTLQRGPSAGPAANSASASRLMQPQSKPPLNNLASLQAVHQMQSFAVQPMSPNPDGYTSGSYAGPSTSSAEAHNRSRLVLGGNLDNEDDGGRIETNLRTPLQPVDSEADVMHQSSHVMRSRPGGVPPPLRDRAPGGSVVGRTHSSHRNRDKDRSESREKDRGGDHDRDRDERRRRRDHSESRERDRHRHHRSSEDKRSSSRRGERDRDRDRDREKDRDRDRDRDREHKHRDSDNEGDYHDEDRRHRSGTGSRQKSSSHQRSSRPNTRETSDAAPYRNSNTGGRIYEQEEEEDVYPISEGMENLNLSMKNSGQRNNVQNSPYVTADMRDLTNPHVGTPQVNENPNQGHTHTSTKVINRPLSATVPTNSLLDAANASARTRKGHSAGKTRRPDEYRSDLQHSRDANPDEFQPVAVNIRQVNHSSSIDDLV